SAQLTSEQAEPFAHAVGHPTRQKLIERGGAETGEIRSLWKIGRNFSGEVIGNPLCWSDLTAPAGGFRSLLDGFLESHAGQDPVLTGEVGEVLWLDADDHSRIR